MKTIDEIKDMLRSEGYSKDVCRHIRRRQYLIIKMHLGIPLSFTEISQVGESNAKPDYLEVLYKDGIEKLI